MINRFYLKPIILIAFFVLTFSFSYTFASQKDLVVVFSGDTLGYVEPCG